jgi:hypothetical protein
MNPKHLIEFDYRIFQILIFQELVYIRRLILQDNLDIVLFYF